MPTQWSKFRFRGYITVLISFYVIKSFQISHGSKTVFSSFFPQCSRCHLRKSVRVRQSPSFLRPIVPLIRLLSRVVDVLFDRLVRYVDHRNFLDQKTGGILDWRLWLLWNSTKIASFFVTLLESIYIKTTSRLSLWIQCNFEELPSEKHSLYSQI